MASDPRRSVSTPTPITPGTDIPRNESTLKNSQLYIISTLGGNVVIKLPGGNLTITVPAGTTVLYDIEVIGIVVAGTTATATYFALS